MRFAVNAGELADQLKRMRPGRKVGSRNRAPHVQLTAGGNVLVILSELSCSASIPATVITAGTGKFPHESGMKVLRTFGNRATVEIRLEADCAWIGPLRLPLTLTQ